MVEEQSTGIKLTNGLFAFSALGLVSQWHAQALPVLVWWYLLWFVLTRTNGYLTDAFGRFLAAVVVCAGAPVIIVTIGLLLKPLTSVQALILASPLFFLSSIYAVSKILAAMPRSTLTVDRPDSISPSDDSGE
jgi:hypothetical protein